MIVTNGFIQNKINKKQEKFFMDRFPFALFIFDTSLTLHRINDI